MRIVIGGLAAIVLASMFSTHPQAAATPCEKLAALALPNTTITEAQLVQAGAFTPPGTGGDGRAFRTLNIVDDFSRECVAIEVDRSLPGARVVRVLERLQVTSGLPRTIVVDNGPEFAGRTLEAWAYTHRIELRFIRPGKPIENAYVESFNGKFRDECLNELGLSASRRRRR